jgi:TDG/mug DNA glycosylase family protein
VPNPSGLNAHSSLADLSAAYREVAIAAGLDLRPD